MRKKWLIVGLIVVAAGGRGTALWLDRADGEDKTATAAVVTADVGPSTAGVVATGTLRAAGSRHLGFAADGTVAAVAVRPGARVKAGDVLAEMDDTEATGAVDDARLALTEAEGQLARARSVTATAGTDPILPAQQRVNQARADLAEAEAARTGATITAPVAGTVMAVAGPVGSRVRRGDIFVTLADTNAMQVDAGVPEADAGRVAAGQDATVTLTDRVGERYPATVLRVDPVGTRNGALVTYGVLLNFARQPAGVLAGQRASAEIRTGAVAGALRVPVTAVHETSGNHGTVLVSGGERQVELGLRGDRYVQITGGLTAGERVVRSW